MFRGLRKHEEMSDMVLLGEHRNDALKLILDPSSGQA